MNKLLFRLSLRKCVPLLSSLCVIFFVAVIVLMFWGAVLSERSSYSFRGSMLISASLSLPTFIIATTYALRQSVRMRDLSWRALIALGLPGRSLRRYLYLENLALTALGFAIAIPVENVWWAIMLKTVYSPFLDQVPGRLVLVPKVIGISFFSILAFVQLSSFIGLRKLGTLGRLSPPRRVNRTLTIGSVVLGMLALTLMMVIGVPRDKLFQVSGILGPMAMILAPGAAVLTGRLVSGLRWTRMTSAVIIGAILGRRLPTAGAISVVALAIGLPLGMLSYAGTGEAITHELVAREVSPGVRFAVVDGSSFIDPASARRFCADNPGACVGMMTFVLDSGQPDVGKSEFVLVGDVNLIDATLTRAGQKAEMPAGLLAYPWARIAGSNAGTELGSWIVLKPGATFASRTPSAAMDDLPRQLFYGPRGTGAREFIPLLAYSLFAALLIVFTVGVAHAQRLDSAQFPLRVQGESGRAMNLSTGVAMLLPAVTIASLTVGVCGFYSVLMVSSWLGEFRLMSGALGGVSGLWIVASPLVMLVLSFVVTRRR